MTAANKFFLVKLEPVLNSGVVEGSGDFKLPLNLDYKYQVDKEDKTSHKTSGDKRLKVSCNTDGDCEGFNLIYEPAITQQQSVSIEISTRLDNWNRKIISGFKIKVRSLRPS